MTEPANYTIYNASAGSGKTYSLVKAYLQIILNSKKTDYFKHLLAITFTNKAVFEMKSRLIELLREFSDDRMLYEPHPMFVELCQSIQLSAKELQERSAKTLEYILHNYAAFNISTIDGFNHQLIRHFSHDLHLNPFFEVQLDSQTLLERAVDNLMNRAGTEDNAELTALLIEFSSEKIDEDKSWDTTQELLEVAKMLTDENHYKALQNLKEKTLEDFKSLKNNLLRQRKEAFKTIKTVATDFITLMQEHHLDRGAFNRGSLYDFFDKLTVDKPKEPSWDNKWQGNLIEGETLYTDSASKKYNTAIIDSLQDSIADSFLVIKKAFGTIDFMSNALKYIVPLALLNRIQNEIEAIKEEENILPIWEFNGMIAKEITSQPAAFIYERIGEKFRHYFIDEFQDTSILQWQNIIPLIQNAVQSEINKQQGSLLLVGDAKQSIYRWRGGEAEQFIDLYTGKSNPFFIEGEVVDLIDNYRSLQAIINFNNHFFEFVSSQFQTERYRVLYQGAQQCYPKVKEKKTLPEGYLSLSFIATEDDTTIEESYCKAILEKIDHANKAGAEDKDITILVRTNKAGATVASFLSDHKRNVISPDSLLLKNVASIQFLISLLRLLYHPESEELKVQMLFAYIRTEGKGTKEAHDFLSKYVGASLNTFFAMFGFSIELFNQYSLYEGIALAVNCFELARPSDAYLTHFMDIVLDFKNGRKGGLADFLEFWDDQQEKLSISSPEGLDAITVMTVHKSKGLSAPVIIYAFADSKLIDSHTERIWFPVEKDAFNGFDSLLVSNNKSLLNYCPEAQELIEQYQEQNLLDQINVLYVAMTRPESFLYIITSLPERGGSTYGTLFKEFLVKNEQWNDDIMEYTFGNAIFPEQKEKRTTSEHPIPFQRGWQTPHYKIATGASMLWDTHKQEALERGNLIHNLFSKLTYATDLEAVLDNALQEGTLTAEQYELLQPQMTRILSDSTLAPFFSKDYEYFMEREFIDANGNYFRPDRLAYKPSTREVYIIDYKTGQPNDQYSTQLQHYQQNLTAIGWQVKGKYLVYLDLGEVKKVL